MRKLRRACDDACSARCRAMAEARAAAWMADMWRIAVVWACRIAAGLLIGWNSIDIGLCFDRTTAFCPLLSFRDWHGLPPLVRVVRNGCRHKRHGHGKYYGDKPHRRCDPAHREQTNACGTSSTSAIVPMLTMGSPAAPTRTQRMELRAAGPTATARFRVSVSSASGHCKSNCSGNGY